MNLDEIIDNFEFLDEWEDKYRYVIELGRSLPEFPQEYQVDANKVEGCASQVWLIKEVGEGADPTISFSGDSDAHIVKGLVALVLALFSGKKASEIVAQDPTILFNKIGLKDHLTPQRANGLNSMIARIKQEALAAQQAA